MQRPTLGLGRQLIGGPRVPYVIMEAGVNHENDMEVALQMVRAVALAKGDAIKFQTYKAAKLAAAASPTYWDERATQREYFERYDKFGPQEYARLASEAGRVGIDFMSTPFDLESLEYLVPLMPAVKIASADITNWPLLEAAASSGLPLILSTGASTLSEIAAAVERCQTWGAKDIALLHCILHYPAAASEANLRSIPFLQAAFPGRVIGYSDHTEADPENVVLLVAAALGAAIIEKHFTHNKKLPGNDHYHAIDGVDLTRLMAALHKGHDALGGYGRPMIPSEMAARTYARRSVVSAVTIPAGTPISVTHLTTKRPGTGIPANFIDLVIGRRARADIAADTVLTWDLVG